MLKHIKLWCSTNVFYNTRLEIYGVILEAQKDKDKVIVTKIRKGLSNNPIGVYNETDPLWKIKAIKEAGVFHMMSKKMQSSLLVKVMLGETI